jgi:hypothetical protein
MVMIGVHTTRQREEGDGVGVMGVNGVHTRRQMEEGERVGAGRGVCQFRRGRRGCSVHVD